MKSSIGPLALVASVMAVGWALARAGRKDEGAPAAGDPDAPPAPLPDPAPFPPLDTEPPAPLPPGWARWTGARPEPRGAPENSILAVPGLASATPEVRAALLDLAEELGIPVDSLAVVISNESGFNPRALNPLPAAGLIQLTVGAHLPGFTTKDAILSVLDMPGEEQVQRIVRPYYKRTPSAAGAHPGMLYMLNFLPSKAGMPEDTVLGRKGAEGFEGKVYAANSGFDREKKGTILIADVYRAAAGVAARAHGARLAVDGLDVGTAST